MILVTGANGFVGSALIERLVMEGVPVPVCAAARMPAAVFLVPVGVAVTGGCAAGQTRGGGAAHEVAFCGWFGHLLVPGLDATVYPAQGWMRWLPVLLIQIDDSIVQMYKIACLTVPYPLH